MITNEKLKPVTLAKSVAAFTFSTLLAVTAATAQVSGGTGIDASGSTRSEMAACNSGQTQQDRETCMREARNAGAEKRSGRLETGGQLGANASQRCDALSGSDKVACEARVQGLGNTSGSVAGGGVIREVETVVVPADGTVVNVQPQTRSDTLIVIPATR